MLWAKTRASPKGCSQNRRWLRCSSCEYIEYSLHRAPCHHQFWLQRTRVSLCYGLRVFIHSSSEFHRPRTRRVTQGTRRRGEPGAAFSLATCLLAAQKKVASPGSATRRISTSL